MVWNMKNREEPLQPPIYYYPEQQAQEKAKENLVTSTGGRNPQPCQKSDKAAIDTKKELAKVAKVSHDTIEKVKKIEAKAIEKRHKKERHDELTSSYFLWNVWFADAHRGERKLGDMLTEVERSEGGRPSKNSFHHETSYQQTLRDNKLPPITAHRWQRLFDISEEHLTRYIAECAEIKLRAERRAGEMLGENPDIHPGGDRRPLSHDVIKLSELGISLMQSHRWQLDRRGSGSGGGDTPNGR